MQIPSFVDIFVLSYCCAYAVSVVPAPTFTISASVVSDVDAVVPSHVPK